MLRRANEHEEAAFFLVERTMRRTRPVVGPLGLKSVSVPQGRIERGSLGRLRFRFDGQESDFAPENELDGRSLSNQEASWWDGVQRMVTETKPITDSRWNLVSMRIGSRVLSRLPLGSVVTFIPDESPPFQSSLDLSVSRARLGRELAHMNEAELLYAIDLFLDEDDGRTRLEPASGPAWNPKTFSDGGDSHSISLSWARNHNRARSRPQKCPVCRSPVVRGPFNPHIPVGTLRPGSGAIRDLRGGYMSRLRETYIVEESKSLLASRSAFTDFEESPPDAARGM